MSTDPLAELADERGTDAGGLTCDGCGTGFVHEGRGRKPKNCPDCRATRATRATPAEDSAPKRPRGIEALQRNLQQQLIMVGIGVAFFDQFDSKVIVQNAEKGAKALANLAETNPKIRKALESGIEGAGYLPVAMWLAGTVLPIAAHHGFIRGVSDPAPTPAPSGPSPSGGAAPNGMPFDLSGLVGPRV